MLIPLPPHFNSLPQGERDFTIASFYFKEHSTGEALVVFFMIAYIFITLSIY
jgi:hypothetical protein